MCHAHMDPLKELDLNLQKLIGRILRIINMWLSSTLQQ